MRVGNGAFSPGRATSATRSVAAFMRGSIRSTLARLALIAHTAPAPAVTARVAGSMRTSRRDPSVTHTPPAPAATEVLCALDRGGGPRRKRIGRAASA
jgi:hypothetical protein